MNTRPTSQTTNSTDTLKLLDALISIKSTADRPAALTEIITLAEKYFAVPELKTERFTKNGKENLLIFPAEAAGRTFDIVLNAHLDVVPANDALFSLKIEDGKAFGRGVIDMKGAAAVMMKLYRDLAVSGQLHSVALTLVTDEEVGGHDGAKALLEEGKVRANFFLAGEPTNLGICYQQKGILWLELVEKGKAAHGSKPWEGQNANVSLAQKITDFYAKTPQPTGKDDWRTSYNVAAMHGGGEAKNIVADKAVAHLDVRRVQTESTDDIVARLRKTFTDTTITIRLDEPCLDTNPDNEYIHRLSRAIERGTKQKAALTRETFGSDSRFFSAAGVPAINFGPIGGDMHGDNEWLDVASLDRYYEILKDFLLSQHSEVEKDTQ